MQETRWTEKHLPAIYNTLELLARPMLKNVEAPLLEVWHVCARHVI